MQTLDSSEDADLELMFAEIRRYPLLTADAVSYTHLTLPTILRV